MIADAEIATWTQMVGYYTKGQSGSLDPRLGALARAVSRLLAERQQLQQDLSEAQELSRIREAQIKEELDCISSFQLQLQAKEEEEARLREAMAEYLSAYDGIMRGGLAATERLSIALSTLRRALEENDAV